MDFFHPFANCLMRNPQFLSYLFLIQIFKIEHPYYLLIAYLQSFYCVMNTNSFLGNFFLLNNLFLKVYSFINNFNATFFKFIQR